MFLFLSLLGCSAEYSAVYQSVMADSKWDESQRIIINRSKQELSVFKAVENKLYLMLQWTQLDWSIRKSVDYPSWGKGDVSRLIAEHQNLKVLLPEEWNNWLPKGFGDECKGEQINR